MSSAPLSYKPSAWYYRKALRESKDPRQIRVVGLHVVSEYERLREWVREQGMIPPKWRVSRAESFDKGWMVNEG